MKIENFIVFCLVVFFTFTNEQIKTLRIASINPNGNFLEKNNINFSSKTEANNLINNLNQNPNLNTQLINDKDQPPTFSQSFVEKPKLGITSFNSVKLVISFFILLNLKCFINKRPIK